MHKLEITLKQHTPLIHFQHDQEGATLRASEVKPKLDKFILTKLGEKPTHEQIIVGMEKAVDEKKDFEQLDFYEKGRLIAKGQDWLIGKGEYPALDYKISISIIDSTTKKVFLKETESETKWDNKQRRNVTKHFLKYVNKESGRLEDFPFLLANMGGKEENEELINLILYDKLKMVLKSNQDKLLSDVIKVHLATFFANLNFGQRTTKGFGSFTVSQIDNNEIEWDQEFENYFPDRTQLMEFTLDGACDDLDKQYRLFKTIDFYWRVLKSGINYTRRFIDNEGDLFMKHDMRYIKSFLWKYLNDKDKNWEKREVKNHFSLETPFPVRHIANANNPVFARALLGCPDKYEYRIPLGTTFKDNYNKWRENSKTYIVNIENAERDKEKKIERIASPIIFKPVISNDNRTATVYILIDKSIISALNKHSDLSFIFSCETNPIPLSLSIESDSINHEDLIVKFHRYFWSDPEVSDKIFFGSNLKREDRKFKMIPRDFDWKNILGEKSETKSNFNAKEGNEKLVSFFQTTK